MKDFDVLKEIWDKQGKALVPDVSLILSKAKKEKQSIGNKMILQVVALLGVIPAIGLVVMYVNFKMATTFIGIGLMALAVIVISILRMYQVYTLKKIDLAASPQSVLKKLEQFYAFQQTVNTKYTLVYFIVLNIAFGFYFIEVMQPMSTTYKSIALTLYVTWMLIAYFIIGKRQREKEYAKMQRIINGIKEIGEGFKFN